MDQSQEEQLFLKSQQLCDLLLGLPGAGLACIEDLRKHCASLSEELEGELALRKELGEGDADVAARQKHVNAKQLSLNAAQGRLDAVAVHLGEAICVKIPKTSISTLEGVEETFTARERLAGLRSKYDRLAPAVNAGLWEKGKAVAARALVSGKLLLQERKCKDLQKGLAKAAFEEGLLAVISTADTKEAVDAVASCYKDIESVTIELSDATAKLEDAKKRHLGIEASDKKITALQARVEASKSEMVAALLAHIETAGCDHLHADIVTCWKEFAELCHSGGHLSKAGLKALLGQSEVAHDKNNIAASFGREGVGVAQLSSLHKKAQESIAGALEQSEQILLAQPGVKSALVATDRRVLICKWGVTSGSFFASQLNSWDWAHITGIEHRGGLLNKCIVVQTAGGQVVTKFGTVDSGPQSVWEAPNALFIQGDGLETVAVLRRKIADHHLVAKTAVIAPPSTGPAEEIRKFAALRDDGLISEEEFQAKKRALLGL